MSIEISALEGIFDGYKFVQGPLSVEVKAGKITSIVEGELRNPAIDGRGKFLSVPFTDGHTHLIFAGDRSFELPMKVSGMSYAEILENGGGILTTVKQTREATDDELLKQVLRRLDLMMLNGSLQVEAKSGYGLNVEQEIRLLEVLKRADELHPVKVVPTFCGAHAIPFDNDRKNYIEELEAVMPEISRKKLATSSDVFCDRGAYTVEETRELLTSSLEAGLPVKVHADELEYTGIGRIAAEEFHALSADHLLLAGEEDFDALARSDTVAMFMPAAVIGLFSTEYPKGWQGKDLTIGLGSDFNPNNVVTSMQTAIRLAVFLYRMSPEAAMRAATSGSHLGITGEKFHPLKEGDPATFILVNAPTIANMVSRFDENCISYVYKDGEIVSSREY